MDPIPAPNKNPATYKYFNLHLCWDQILDGTLLGTITSDLHPSILRYSSKSMSSNPTNILEFFSPPFVVGKLKDSYAPKFRLGPESHHIDRPWNSTIDQDGNIYIVEHYGNAVQHFGPNGQFIKKFRPGLSQPIGIATLTNGNILVTEFSGSRIGLYSPDGKQIKTIGSYGDKESQFHNPYDVKVDRHGNVVVADTWNRRIQIFSSNLDYIREFPLSSDRTGSPTGLCINSDGNYVVLDNSIYKVTVFSPQGEQLSMFALGNGTGSDQVSNPLSMAVDCEGKIIIADFGNDRIQIFSPEGKHLSTFGRQGAHQELECMNHPVAVMLDVDGNIYVSDYDNCRVVVWG